MPRAESILRKDFCQDIPELTVCRVKAKRGTALSVQSGWYRGAELHPQCEFFCVGDGAFFIKCKMQRTPPSHFVCHLPLSGEALRGGTFGAVVTRRDTMHCVRKENLPSRQSCATHPFKERWIRPTRAEGEGSKFTAKPVSCFKRICFACQLERM